jgi:hypothetical protein
MPVRWLIAASAALAVVVVATLLMLSDGNDREAASDYDREDRETLGEVDRFAARCHRVPASSVRFVEAQITVPNGEITESGAARSRELDRTWLVATRIEGEDFDELALFAVDDVREPSSASAVDATGEAASEWPVSDGSSDSPEITLGDDGTDEALECID